jgi:hypothetical protein
MNQNLRTALAVFLISLSYIAVCGGQAWPSGVQACASSSESDLYRPANVVDGNYQSRWSSQFSDPQWLLLDLGQVMEICGVTIKWEAAYGKSYEVQVSSDNSEWKTVYEITDSDGGTDEAYFRKVPARYVKIFMKERGTFWGYSVFEVMVKGPDEEPVVTASYTQDISDPSNAFDGDRGTEWLNDSCDEAWITVDLKKQKDIGGVQLNWGLNYAKSYDILVSGDGNSWKKVFSNEKGNGSKDLIYLDPTRARFIKVQCRQSNTGSGYSLKEIMLKGPDESATPQKHFELLAEETPAGYYPKWLNRQQAYWTVVGIDGDDKECLLCEDGTIEPYSGSYSFMPYLYDGSELITSCNSKVTQSLEKGYLPLPEVEWERNGLVFTQRLFASGERGSSAAYIWYTIENRAKEKFSGKFFLTVRPFQVNPPWQHGGLSEIRSVSFEGGAPAVVRINGVPALISVSKPDNFGAARYKGDDITDYIEKGSVPSSRAVDDPDKYASGALEYSLDLSAGKKADLFFAIPLHGNVGGLPAADSQARGYFNGLLEQQKKYWQAKLDAVDIEVPDAEIIDAMKSNLGYILINKDILKLQPGSRNYKKAWMRDGALISAALLRMGYKGDVKEFLDWIAQRQYGNGMVPFILEEGGMPGWCRDWKEYDSQGEFIFSIYDYYRFTNDREFLENKWPNIMKALEYLVDLRKQRLADYYCKGADNVRIFCGILPESNSHEGYFPAMHSYWDDFWALKGWEDAGSIARILGKEDAAEWINSEKASFRKSVYESIDLAMKVKGIDFIPGCADKGDFDATSTAIAVFPCSQLEYLPRPQLDNTFDKYFKESLDPRSGEGWKGGFTPYEVRSISALILMGKREQAFRMLEYFQTVKRPREWNHWAEVVFSGYRHPQYIGDMPHTWIGAEYICAVRNMFVYEDGDKLIIGAGIPKEWAESGKEIKAQGLPTYYGDVSFSLKPHTKGLKLEVRGKASPPGGFVFNDPRSGKEFTFNKLPATILVSGKGDE